MPMIMVMTASGDRSLKHEVVMPGVVSNLVDTALLNGTLPVVGARRTELGLVVSTSP